jgi:hypothetical protein
MIPDDKAKIGVSYCHDKSIHWDFFRNKSIDFEIDSPLVFKIEQGKFSGSVSDYQINNCGFYLFSPRLREIIDNHLSNRDLPKWYESIVTDMENKDHQYFILNFFKFPDLLDYTISTFSDAEKKHPIKKFYDIEKIGDRLLFGTEFGSSFYVHDIVRKEIRKNCSNTYFFGIHKPGRLS